MPVTEVSNNQSVADLILNNAQSRKKPEEVPADQEQQNNKAKAKNGAPAEGVKVTLSKEAVQKANNNNANANQAEKTQQPEESRNKEAERAVQAYKEANAATENNNKPEKANEKTINRVAGK